MKIPLTEPTAPRFIYINPKTNKVHLLLPLMSGTDIGLDNTCKTAYSLREFFGLIKQNSGDVFSELQRYQNALQFDLHFAPHIQEKAERLTQIKVYLNVLKELIKNPQITALNQQYPQYPASLAAVFNQEDANVFSMVLRSKEQDVYLITKAIKAGFRVNHSYLDQGKIVPLESQLYATLVQNFKGLSIHSKSKEHLINQLIAKIKDLPVDFELIKTKLSAEIKAYLGFDFNFSQTSEHPVIPVQALTQVFIDEALCITIDNPATHQSYIQALLAFGAPCLFDALDGSPFYSIAKEEHLVLLTQFFLAQINMECYSEGLTTADWGQMLEGQKDLVESLAQEVKSALSQNRSVEESLIEFINKNLAAFQSKDIQDEHKERIKKRFKSHYEQIKSASHFDEFMLLSNKRGPFFTHQGSIVLAFSRFMQTGIMPLNKALKKFFDEMQADFERVDLPQNCLAHKNEHIQCEGEIDVGKISDEQAQHLYEHIQGLRGPMRGKLLQQFGDCCPYFVALTSRQFVQCVAYGQQGQAEQLLLSNQDQAQMLLKTCHIQFSDYSARTFKCTAYEYAYWAKDAHMLRMLEQYIKRDEDTKAFILQRIKAMEELIEVSQPSLLGFFSRKIVKPRGLHYTTVNENQEKVDHWELHFDLSPLKKVLQRHELYSGSKSSKRTRDWRRLEEIWLELGLQQRLIPAHIAQEYCQPGRTFYDVVKDKSLLDVSNPNNLKRQFLFKEYSGQSYKPWFSVDNPHTSLGTYYSIGCGSTGAVGSRQGYGFAHIDIKVINLLDEVRTQDLKQSIEMLSPKQIPKAQALLRAY